MTSPDPDRLNAALVEAIAERMSMPLPERVAAAFRAVPRHLFVPGVPLETAYEDAVVVLKVDGGEPRSSSSQPTIMAIMLAQLDVREGDRVLEIGAGSGYNAALLARLAGPRGQVVTIDVDDELATDARAKLAAAGVENVEVVAGDGADGFAAGAPYDRMIATAAVWDVPAAWRAQLAPDGRIVMPLMIHGAQACVAFTRAGETLESDSIVEGGFMPLRGSSARASPARLPLGRRPGLTIEFPAAERPPAPAGTLYAWLSGAWTEVATTVTVDEPGELFGAHHRMALRDASVCRLSAYGEDAERDLLPPLPAPGFDRRAALAAGLADADGLALLALGDPPARVVVRRYGSGSTAARLVAHLEAWAAAGREPGLPRRIRVYPAGASTPAGAGGIARRESVVVLS